MTSNSIAQSYGKPLDYTNIQNSLFKEYDVKEGLRNENGTGARVELTRTSDVVSYDIVGGKKTSVLGELYFRGLRVNDLMEGRGDPHFGYEETCPSLLFGYLPNKQELRSLCDVVNSMYRLPHKSLEMRLMRMSSHNLMNCIQQSVLSPYDYDDNPDDVDSYHTVLKGLDTLAKLLLIICYGYHSKVHYYNKSSLFVHYAKKEYSIVENILHMPREDRKFTLKEAELLDTLPVLHADHGDGNNSTFTSVVIFSTATDLYSTMVGSIGSLKGLEHGGVNARCAEMTEVVIKEIGINADEKVIRGVLKKILDRDFHDNFGLTYGPGHTVYAESDPKAEVLHQCYEDLAKEKKREEGFALMARFETMACDYFQEVIGRRVPNNVDSYGGFAYNMLNIPNDLYTPLSTYSRTIGWLVHNIENKLYNGKIARLATEYVGGLQEYKKIAEWQEPENTLIVREARWLWQHDRPRFWILSAEFQRTQLQSAFALCLKNR